MSRKRRKKEFVDPEVQGALARRLILHWAFFMTAAVGLAVMLTWMANPFAGSLLGTLQEAAGRYGPLLMVLACLAPVFVHDAVKMSGRFSGPVFRIRQATRQLAAGEYPERVEFRGSDFWKDLAADFNAVVQRLRDQEAQDETA